MSQRHDARTFAASHRTDAAQDIVYRWLKQHVLTLPRHEGTFLTEAEVCRETGTSRTPVREALLRLEADGLLQIVPKKGAYVPPITEAEIEAVMQARGLVEEWCARQAAGFGEVLATELDRLVAMQVDLHDDSVAFIECDREFHGTIVRAAGNPMLASFYESLRDRQLRMGVHAITISGGRADSVIAEHAAIVEGIRRGQPEQAAAAVAEHLARTLVALRPIAAGWAGGFGNRVQPGAQRL
ncbi:GntR family transcriptional regulator [Mesorhizobium sp. YC-39]|uniref:GntR family transcriptional regulator n=1 Tax=unclassified Mesorhizobium TaxID=325217 RepID=UPI0021E6F6F2|nr:MULTISPECIES: GntR family transcriptional regulator [unclassified Mesorhizobium]MCV3210917.1 GntR family transcriptional regulator [Mesorhizobium sp. YC-2]MCV3231151.1 GntR family transcriptional regulator [Mesorhizobium sp. YC-39]